MKWFYPTWCGDFRLEPDNEAPETRTILTVVDPTAADKKKLEPFVVELRSRGLLGALDGIAPVGKTTIPIESPMLEMGPLLAKFAVPEGEKWTVVRHENGLVTVESGDGTSLVERLKKAAISVKDGIGELVDAALKTPVAAATFAAPARGCPAPRRCNRRASEVLATFSTKSQYAMYIEHGYLKCHGNITGKPYLVFHRDEAARRGMGHCVVHDIERGTELCAWDDTVPPEEETLSLKLGIEHREEYFLS